MPRLNRRVRVVGTVLLGTCLGAGAWAVARPSPAHDAARRPDGAIARPAPATPLWRVDAALSARLQGRLARGVGALDGALARLEQAHTPAARRLAFRAARVEYKRMEGVLAYHAPTLVAALNGTEADDEEDAPDPGRVVTHGFPRIERRVFARAGARDAAADSAVRAEVTRMRTLVARFGATLPALTVADAGLLEVARRELARVSTLGIAGVDAGPSGDAMREGAAAVDGVRALVGDVARAAAVPTPEADAADARLAAASAYLRAHPDFARFDRFAFVTAYANPAFAALAALRARVPAPDAALRRAWPRAVASVYDARGFDAMAYAAADAPRATPAWVALGRDLFADPALSGDGGRACASCHVPARGFTDGRSRAASLALGHGRVDARPARPLRHTPRLAYAAWQPAQFADARAATLEDQVDSVLASPAEMGSSGGLAAAHLARSPEYRRRLAAAGGAITPSAVQRALAAYVRTLGRFDSRFDRAVRGERVTLTSDERHGFNLFMGRARCGTCHFAPLFNGTAPPDFAGSAVEVIGVPDVYRSPNGARSGPVRVDPDSGRAALDRLGAHLHAFRTPSVRGAALGGPYMHNGALRTLDDVLDFYDRGGGAGLGADVPNQTLSAEPLHLTARDRRALTAFLRALAEPAGATPADAPSATTTAPSDGPPR